MTGVERFYSESVANHDASTTLAANEKPGETRLGFMDVAKLVAVLAVVTGHTALRFEGQFLAERLTAVCFSFHLPLFFMVSGYFMHVDRPFRWKHNLRALMVPYGVTAAAVVVGTTITAFVLKDQGSSKEVLFSWANAAVFAAGDVVTNPLWPQQLRIGAIWFLPALLWARLVVWAAYKTKHPWAMVLLAFMLGFFSARLVFLPLSVQAGLCAALFVYFGQVFRNQGVLGKGGLSFFEWAVVAILWLCAIFGFEGFSMATSDYGAHFVDVLRNIAGGIGGSLCVVKLCELAERSSFGSTRIWKGLSKLGRFSLLIMCVHLFEDDVLRWGQIVSATGVFLPSSLGWFVVLIVRVLVDVSVAAALSRIPFVAVLFNLRPSTTLLSGSHGVVAGKKAKRL